MIYFLGERYPYVVHAEANAILNSSSSLKNSTVYVTLFPCNECAKLLIQSGVKHIKYMSDKHKNQDSTKASKRMLEAAGVTYEQMPELNLMINLK